MLCCVPCRHRVELALSLSGVLRLLSGMLCCVPCRHRVELALSLSGVLRLLNGMLCCVLSITEWSTVFAEWYAVLCTMQTQSRTGIITEWCAVFAEWYAVLCTEYYWVVYCVCWVVCCVVYHADTEWRHTVELALALSGVLRLLSGLLCTTQTHSRTGLSTEWFVVYHTDTQ